MGTNILHQGGWQIFFLGGVGWYDDVDEEMDVSETNILLSEGSKLSAAARFLGPCRSLKF